MPNKFVVHRKHVQRIVGKIYATFVTHIAEQPLNLYWYSLNPFALPHVNTINNIYTCQILRDVK